MFLKFSAKKLSRDRIEMDYKIKTKSKQNQNKFFIKYKKIARRFLAR
jgi:hypothetical protein